MRKVMFIFLLVGSFLAYKAGYLPVSLPEISMGMSESQGRPGVEPLPGAICPSSHPIRGNFTTYSRERCIHHMWGQRYYDRTKPERCYANENEARRDGCRRAKV